MRAQAMERHRTENIGWLRAAVLGANDGIISTASLLLGVANAHASHRSVLITGAAGMAAGAMSMASGEYVSVHSQADTEKAELGREQLELAQDPAGEQEELAAIYRQRGLDAELARQVAQQLMAVDALGAHARDELGMSVTFSARPIQAALASAASFTAGAAIPLLMVTLAPPGNLAAVIATASLVCLAFLGGVAAQVGGAAVLVGAARVTFWGALAMGVTAGVGAMVGHLSQP